MDCPSHPTLEAANEAFNETVECLPQHIKPHIKRCWAFQPRDSDRTVANPSSQLVLVEDSAFYLNTLIADIVGSVLSWFADTAGERRRNDGRQSKLYGDLFLMSGRLKDSLTSYNDGLSQMRAPHDSFHQASAIESQAIAQVLLYWQKTDDVPSHHLIETPWSGICDKFNNALAVYTRLLNTSINKALSTSSTTNLTNLPSQNHDLIAIRAFVRATLRLSQFLLTVWACEGLNDNSLKALVEGVTPSFLATQPDRDSIIEHADKMPHLARSQISTIAQQAHGTHLFHLNKVEQLRVILTLIHLHDSIGFARKAAYFRQEVVVICADLVEASRNKSLIQSSDSKLIVNQLNDNNELLVKILDNICDVYGIDTQSTYLYVNGEESEATENVQQEVENNFKWISVQRDFLRDAMTVVQHLGDLNAVIKYAVILLKVYHASLPAAEQVRLVQIMLAALEALRRRSTTSVELAFWSPDLLLSLEVIP